MTELPPPPHAAPVARAPRARWLGLALAIGYAAMALAGQRLAANLLVALMASVLCWVAGYRWLAGLLGAGLAFAVLGRTPAATLLAYLPPLAVFAFMAWFFGRTLRPGREPLITRIARKEHPELPAGIAHYTRKLTRLWAASFLALLAWALVSAPALELHVWSRWVQALGYLMPGALFLGEYVFRRYRFANIAHASIPVLIANTVRVIRESSTELRQPPQGTVR